ncbi:hypothetical protein Dimus_018439 [Dionaea muscipula]
MSSHRYLCRQRCRFGCRQPWRLDDPVVAAALHPWRVAAASDGACSVAPMDHRPWQRYLWIWKNVASLSTFLITKQIYDLGLLPHKQRNRTAAEHAYKRRASLQRPVSRRAAARPIYTRRWPLAQPTSLPIAA